MEWICIFRGLGPTDASLAHDWLERNDIPSQVRGDLMSCIGEIPILDAWPTLWIHASDEVRAREAMKLFHAPRLVSPRWSCAHCGEDNEPTFDSCWSCQKDRV